MSDNANSTGKPKADHAALPGWLPGAAIGALGVLAVLGLVFLSGKPRFGATGQPVGTTATIAPAPTLPAAPVRPNFDTVRIDAGGNAVIAGHADPGAMVTIIANGQAIGTAKADDSGSFVFVTTKPLAPGSEEIALSTTTKAGQTLTSPRDVAVAVPEAPNEGALAVLAGNGRTPSQVLTGQGPEPGTLGISSVDYSNNGHAMISGTAKPGAEISLSLGGVHLGTAVAGADGRWTLHTDHMPNRPGTFKLETLDKSGAVTGSMKTAFAPREAGPLKPGQVVVVPGECLWLIAQQVYGQGTDYAMIYRANEASIRDPNLIYPGQRLTLPAAGAPAPSAPPAAGGKPHAATAPAALLARRLVAVG